MSSEAGGGDEYRAAPSAQARITEDSASHRRALDQGPRRWYTAAIVKVVDAAHLLPDGDLPPDGSPIRRHALAVARFIEYGGPIERGESCVMLVECPLRPRRKPCRTLLWVHKTMDDRIEAFCPSCGELQYVISNWRDTLWADGPMVLPNEADIDQTH